MERRRALFGALALTTAFLAGGCDRNPKIVDCKTDVKENEQAYVLPIGSDLWLANIQFKPKDNGKITVYSNSFSIRVEPENSESSADVPGIITVHSDNSMTFLNENVLYEVKGQPNEFKSTTVYVKETCFPAVTP